ncbi:MAG: hypothetical protein ABT02_12825 [Comamonadaceae bacterium SCN 68-20]|nr:MAG: hypothetical protein ABT02_12825 [Comamonadaceae bacterium SCN 68-20]OJX14233.1 MAG: hypothetical protein BGO75_05300 [Burkholderiales bacterium 68-20]
MDFLAFRPTGIEPHPRPPVVPAYLGGALAHVSACHLPHGNVIRYAGVRLGVQGVLHGGRQRIPGAFIQGGRWKQAVVCLEGCERTGRGRAEVAIQHQSTSRQGEPFLKTLDAIALGGLGQGARVGQFGLGRLCCVCRHGRLLAVWLG